MGLETVELVMEFEDTFGIDIPDRDAEQLLSVGQTFEYIRRRVARAGVCPSRHVFYRLRKAIIQVTDSPRDAIRPHRDVEELLPAPICLNAWQQLAEVAALTLPRLHRPARIFQIGLCVFICGVITATLSATRSEWIPWPSSLVWAATVAALLMIWLLTVPLAVQLPEGCRTLGDLTRATVARNGKKLRGKIGWSDEEIWKTLQRIVAEQAGVPIDQVTPEKQYVRDLGLD